MTDQTQTPPPLDPNFLSEPGDVITEQMVITASDGRSFDVSNFVVETVLVEDVFANVLTGHVVLLDSANLVNIIPLEGTEYLTFSFRTPSFTETISKSFQITGLSDRAFTSSDREQGYVLTFMSIEGVIDNVTNISKKFSGPTDTVIQRIFTEYLTHPRFITSKGGASRLVMRYNTPRGYSMKPTSLSIWKILRIWFSTNTTTV
jgi:hypothetical protein